MKDEALRLALEALEFDGFTPEDATHRSYHAKAITAIKQALEQPEPEPVAWMWRCKPYCGWPEWSVSLNRPADSGRDGNKRTEGYEDIPLYTSPPKRKWQGLTDEEKSEIYHNQKFVVGFYSPAKFADAIEAKLKEKNT